MPKHGRTIEVAWAGWRMRIPPDWRPLSVTGHWRRGAMMLGDADQALIQIKWWRPGTRRFDANLWARRRLRKAAGRRAAPVHTDPPGNFAFWAGATSADASGEPIRRLGCGYAPQAGLAVEAVVNTAVPARRRKRIDGRALPSLSATKAGDETRWAVFDVSFVVPAGFFYQRSRLHVGDIALCFAAPGGRRLLVRQIYPSGLALSRRDLAKWLDDPPFKEHRKFRIAGQPERRQFASFGRKLDGIVRTGRKALPAPLGFLAPRQTVAAAAEDTELERLLLVEYDDAEEHRPDVVKEAVERMNYACLEATEL